MSDQYDGATTGNFPAGRPPKARHQPWAPSVLSQAATEVPSWFQSRSRRPSFLSSGRSSIGCHGMRETDIMVTSFFCVSPPKGHRNSKKPAPIAGRARRRWQAGHRLLNQRIATDALTPDATWRRGPAKPCEPGLYCCSREQRCARRPRRGCCKHTFGRFEWRRGQPLLHSPHNG